MSIRGKILIPMILLTVICSAAIFATSVWLFNRGLDDAAYSRISIAARGAEHELDSYKASSLMAAVIVAENEEIVKAVKQENHESVLHAATNLVTTAQVDFCTVLNRRGEVLARTHEPESFGDSLLYQSNISHALEGEVTTVIERGTAVALSVRTGAPIKDENGNIIGVVSLGYRLDTPEFVDTLKAITGCEMTLFLGDVIIATTITEAEGRPAVGYSAVGDTADVIAQVLGGEPFLGKMKNYYGDELIVSYTPIFDVTGEILGVLGVGSHTDDNMGRLRTFTINGLIIFFFVIAAAVASALIISHSIDKRINSMMERIRESEKLEIELENAENASRAKSAFMANMSHEIRTPLNVILGITEMRLRDDSVTGETRDGLEQIFDSGKLLLNIVSDILDHSRIEAGKLKIKPRPYNVPGLISDAAQINRLRYDNKPIEFQLEVAPGTPVTLRGDELRIRQILNNLLSNAYKYTDDGEIKMTVRVEAMPTNGVQRGSETQAGDDVMFIVSVSDTGQGMTAEQLDMLFNEYTRFNIDHNRTVDGIGLGLNITKHLAELMGGSIDVSSEAGKGSVFTVSLPQKRVGEHVCGDEMVEDLRTGRFHDKSTARVNSTRCEQMPYARVLVVDDVISNLYVTSSMLRPYGLTIETVKSGFEAIEKIQAGSEYDIIFMDHMMPKMDGIETVKKLRDMGYTRCILALTANAIVGQSTMFKQNGFDGYISKPIDSRELDRMLKKHISDKRRD